MKNTKVLNPLLLLLAAIIWGSAFVAQDVGMDYVQPFTYNAVRSLIGVLVLLPVIKLMDSLRAKRGESGPQGDKKTLIIGGVACGVVLFVASNLQQYGIAMQAEGTNVGKAGFITACYMMIVPIFGLFLGRRSPLRVWIGVAVALVGFVFLCLVGNGALGLGMSDLMLLLCAVIFAIHIMVIDHFSPLVDGVRMSCIQFLVSGLLSAVLMFVMDKPELGAILAAWKPILYAGVLSCGVAYTLQIVGQNGVDPAVASLLLSLESVFAVIFGFLFQGTVLTAWQMLGCALVFAAILLVELKPKRERSGLQ